MGLVVDAGREMKLSPEAKSVSEGPSRRISLGTRAWSYESSIFQALHDIGREIADSLLVRVAGRGLVIERYLFHGCALLYHEMLFLFGGVR